MSDSHRPSDDIPISSEVGNGYTWGDNFSWTQTDGEITMELKLQGDVLAHVQAGGKLMVDFIKPDKLRCSIKGAGGNNAVFLVEQFPFAVDFADGQWSLEDKRQLMLTVEKMQAQLWRCPFLEYPRIDISIDGEMLEIDEQGETDLNGTELLKPVQVTDPAILAQLQKENPDFHLM